MTCRFCADTGFVCVAHGLPMGHADDCDDGEHALCPDPACEHRGKLYDERYASTNPDATHRSGDALDKDEDDDDE